ncbi:ribose operon repressor [Actinobacillus equuli]|nr:ribose operon repressor [Actinobacillus equuli]
MILCFICKITSGKILANFAKPYFVNTYEGNFMATMKDIARIAGVSTSTVSHVINNSRFVSDEIRQRIEKVVAELNYTPSLVARSLKVKETNTIGMLVTTSSNPFLRK